MMVNSAAEDSIEWTRFSSFLTSYSGSQRRWADRKGKLLTEIQLLAYPDNLKHCLERSIPGDRSGVPVIVQREEPNGRPLLSRAVTEAGGGGEAVDRLKLELLPDGRTLINGQPFATPMMPQ